jgi:hypothetical protein
MTLPPSPPGFPFLPLVINFGTRFSKFFCLEDELWNVFSEVFGEFELKNSENMFQSFCTGVKSKYQGVKKSREGEKRIFPSALPHCLPRLQPQYTPKSNNIHTLFGLLLSKNWIL